MADDYRTRSDVTQMELAMLNPHMLVDEAGSNINELVRYMITLEAKKADA
jgi:hypothetical protein